MCGSTDLLKQNDVFICQTCGTKYSVEEAKKMMIEGTVDVQGTVKIDRNNQSKNYLQLAEQYLNSASLQKASECCDKVLEVESNNYHAWKMKFRIAIYSYLVYLTIFDSDSEKYLKENLNLDNDNTLPSFHKAVSYAKNAFSCAKGNEKEDLLMSISDSIISYTKNILSNVPWCLYSNNIGIEEIAKFIISNFEENQILSFIEKYYCSLIDVLDDINYDLVLRLLEIESMKGYIVTHDPELSKKREDMLKLPKTKQMNEEIEILLKDLNDYKSLIQKGSSDSIPSFNEKRQTLISLIKNATDIPTNLQKEIDEIVNLDINSLDINKVEKKGCYVATCVYGSYDCPEVWTLRRFRDYTLAETWYGRAFIKMYYAISPTLVKWFGNTNWFKEIWKKPLDKMVKNLNKQGFEDTKYDDKI